jgi:hypothetical protein
MNTPLNERLLEAFTEYTETKPAPHAGTLAAKHDIDFRMLVGILVFHGHMSEKELAASLVGMRSKRLRGAPRAPLPRDVLDALKQLSEKMGPEAAQVVGVPYNTLRKWLMGDSGPRARRLAELRNILGLPAGRPEK